MAEDSNSGVGGAVGRLVMRGIWGTISITAAAVIPVFVQRYLNSSAPTAPASNAPLTTAPAAIAPEATVPEMAAPEMTAPGATASEATAPEMIESAVTVPTVTVPAATAPELSTIAPAPAETPADNYNSAEVAPAAEESLGDLLRQRLWEKQDKR